MLTDQASWSAPASWDSHPVTLAIETCPSFSHPTIPSLTHAYLLPLQHHSTGDPFSRFWTWSLLPGVHFSNFPFLLSVFMLSTLPFCYPLAAVWKHSPQLCADLLFAYVDEETGINNLICYSGKQYISSRFSWGKVLLGSVWPLRTSPDPASQGPWGKVADCIQTTCWSVRYIGEEK